jgi:hydrogenase maturation protease
MTHRWDSAQATGRPILVIGLGNPLRGDDGVGVRVVEALQAYSLSPDVEVVDGGTQGLGIIPLMEGRERLILIDAADMGAAPGQFVRFEPDHVRLLGDDRQLSVHSAGLREALQLAQALHVLPEDVIIFGVQPEHLDWDAGLSQTVEANLPPLIAAVVADIGQATQGEDKHGKDLDD